MADIAGDVSRAALPRTDAATGGLPYKLLKKTHPDYDAAYWRRCHALYVGGKRLLEDATLMKDVFPKHRDELTKNYEERKRRAVYVAKPAEIIDEIIGSLSNKPLALNMDDTRPSEAAWDEYYDRFARDTSAGGGGRLSLSDMITQQMLNALLYRCAWVLIDLPRREIEYASRAEQEKDGALDAYVVPIEPECVIDWEEDPAGELLWTVIWTVHMRRPGLGSERKAVLERWDYYDRQQWVRYEALHDVDRPLQENDIIPIVASREHNFGRTPLERLQLPDGLWAMNKLENLAREHLNKRSALAWAELQSLLPELYEFLGPEQSTPGTVIGENQEDPQRALSQRRGQGYVQQRGGQDKALFVGPSAEPFAHALNSIEKTEAEMSAITHQMALSIQSQGSALRRSAESKAADKSSKGVVLEALGKLARQHAEMILSLISTVRQDADLIGKWQVKGMDEFEDADAAGLVDRDVSIDVLKIPSATFQKLRYLRLARTHLGDDATADDIAAIEEELETNVTPEQFDPEIVKEEKRDDMKFEASIMSGKKPPPQVSKR